MYKCADGHFVPSYLSKVGTLNLGGKTRSGTKLILLAFTRPYASDPSTILKRSSMSSSFRWASLLSDCYNDSLSFLVISDRQGLESLSGQPCLPRSSLLHVLEVHTHMEIHPFEAGVVLEDIGE